MVILFAQIIEAHYKLLMKLWSFVIAWVLPSLNKYKMVDLLLIIIRKISFLKLNVYTGQGIMHVKFGKGYVNKLYSIIYRVSKISHYYLQEFTKTH